MGKRELLIISLFVVAAVGAYRLTAPRSAPSAPGLSWRTLVDSFRPGTSQPRASASRSTNGTIELPEAVTEIRVSGVARVRITGETRRSASFVLQVDASGQDQTAADTAAASPVLRQDRVGTVLALRLEQPRGARTVTALTLTVPERLAVRTEAGPGLGRIEIRAVAAVHLESIVGDVRLGDIAGAVTGTHRNGELVIAGARRVDLSLASSRTVVDAVRDGLSVSSRNGRLQATAVGGPMDLDLTNHQTILDAPAGRVHVIGTGGTLDIRSPRAPVTVDVRRIAVSLRLDRSVPVSILTADAPLTLALVGLPPMTLDASTSDGGHVRLGAVPFTIDPASDTRLLQRVGAGTTPVALRNERADIVIDAAK